MIFNTVHNSHSGCNPLCKAGAALNNYHPPNTEANGDTSLSLFNKPPSSYSHV